MTTPRPARQPDDATSPKRSMRTAIALVCASTLLSLGGCAVVAVGSTVVSVGAGAVGLAADAAIGTARIAGKAVGATADAIIPGKD